MNNHVQFGFTFEHFGFLIGIKNLNFVEDLPVINGSLIHKCLTCQRRKQKTTPTNDSNSTKLSLHIFAAPFTN